MPDRQELGLGGRRRRREARRKQPARYHPDRQQPPGDAPSQPWASEPARRKGLASRQERPEPTGCRRPAPNPMPARPRNGAPTSGRLPREQWLSSIQQPGSAPRPAGHRAAPRLSRATSPSPPSSRAAVVNGNQGNVQKDSDRRNQMKPHGHERQCRQPDHGRSDQAVDARTPPARRKALRQPGSNSRSSSSSGVTRPSEVGCAARR